MTPEQADVVIAVIRTLGFVGGAHYCPSCMNEFHNDRGQHDPSCSTLQAIQDDEEWWDELGRRLERRA